MPPRYAMQGLPDTANDCSMLPGAYSFVVQGASGGGGVGAPGEPSNHPADHHAMLTQTQG